MRLCRFLENDKPQVGIYSEQTIVPIAAAAKAYADATHEKLALATSDDLLDFLPPDGKAFAAAKKIAAWVERAGTGLPQAARIPTAKARLLVPVPRPNKLFLLAGNYAEHIREGGGVAAERAETFPYVFMKPPSTTLTDPGQPVRIPAVSPGAIDWECELAVVIGRRAKGIKEADALAIVAGYTVINDISNRKFRPNPDRKKREKDAFFDWMHGKWHDSFCPCGPAIASADSVPDPQSLPIKLAVNGQVKQNGSTGQQIFPVAAVIEFIAAITTLEPGDIISTGTPSGVGNATGTYLKPGDVVEASIPGIGTLVSPIVAE
ncbi:MAG: fumarylacetoacetate hydrolase family protein [Planctomycetia bacterium]|nr:fumarylacetoacetate hydrolase family protein [Planctomycetia bacterium]